MPGLSNNLDFIDYQSKRSERDVNLPPDNPVNDLGHWLRLRDYREGEQRPLRRLGFLVIRRYRH
jgi:hypothetical protein